MLIISKRVLLFCTFFSFVQFIDSGVARGNMFFYKQSDVTPASQKAPKTELEANLHQCAQDLCGDFSAERSYKKYSDEIAIGTVKSTYFQSEVMPVLKELRAKSVEDLAEVEGFLNFLKSQKGEMELDDENLREYIFFALLPKLMGRHLPVETKFIEAGPMMAPYDVGFWIGNQFDSKRFDGLVKEGVFQEADRTPIQTFIEQRDTEPMLPFAVSSDLHSIISAQGKGAKQVLSLAYGRLIDFYSIRPYRDSLLGSLRASNLIKERDFVREHFDIILRVASVSDFDGEVASRILGDFFTKELLRTAYPLIEPKHYKIERKISRDLIKKAQLAVEKNLEETNAYLEADVFHSLMTKKCQWKINYIHQALPSAEVLKEREQVVTAAIVKFQSWLFDKFSPQTATAVFDFLRTWQFFFPPSKEEFEDYLMSFIRLDRQNGTFLAKEQFFPAMVMMMSDKSEEYTSESYHSFSTIEDFCDSLSLNPMGDNANTIEGQVHLGWMALRDDRLLKTVVWHELGHILSSLLEGKNVYNLTKSLTGNQDTIEVSSESFVRYLSTKQCLGGNQEQNLYVEQLGEPFVTWAKEGLLEAFPQKEFPVRIAGDLMAGFTRSVGDFGVGAFTTYQSAEDGADLTLFHEIVQYVNGEFVNEDWADLVASAVSEEEGANPFCFMLKDQDHLFWHEKKGMDIDENPIIQEIKERVVSVSANGDGEDNDYLYEDRDWEYIHNSTPKHSTFFYRLLQIEVSRNGILPVSCQKAVNNKPEFQKIRRCDYF